MAYGVLHKWYEGSAPKLCRKWRETSAEEFAKTISMKSQWNGGLKIIPIWKRCEPEQSRWQSQFPHIYSQKVFQQVANLLQVKV